MNAFIPRFDLPTKPVETSTITIKRCNCGAITIDAEDCSNSMTEKTFLKEFPHLAIPEGTLVSFGICNHCINNWGIDLCGCGSGEAVGECDNEYAECHKKEPSQMKMEFNVTIQKDIQSVNDKAELIKQQVVLLINSLPDNPKIIRLSTKVNCFVMRSSDLQDCLSPEYHDFRCQCRALCDELNKRRIEEVIPLIQQVIEKGSLRLLSYRMRFHPTVIDHLQKILLM